MSNLPDLDLVAGEADTLDREGVGKERMAVLICKGDDNNVVMRGWTQRGEATLGRSSYRTLRDDEGADKLQISGAGKVPMVAAKSRRPSRDTTLESWVGWEHIVRGSNTT